jgi:hypothetical protein
MPANTCSIARIGFRMSLGNFISKNNHLLFFRKIVRSPPTIVKNKSGFQKN